MDPLIHSFIEPTIHPFIKCCTVSM